MITSVPAIGMVDDMSYDAQHQRLYLAGDGALDVFEQMDPGHYAVLAKIPARRLPRKDRHYGAGTKPLRPSSGE